MKLAKGRVVSEVDQRLQENILLLVFNLLMHVFSIISINNKCIYSVLLLFDLFLFCREHILMLSRQPTNMYSGWCKTKHRIKAIFLRCGHISKKNQKNVVAKKVVFAHIDSYRNDCILNSKFYQIKVNVTNLVDVIMRL